MRKCGLAEQMFFRSNSSQPLENAVYFSVGLHLSTKTFSMLAIQLNLRGAVSCLFRVSCTSVKKCFYDAYMPVTRDVCGTAATINVLSREDLSQRCVY